MTMLLTRFLGAMAAIRCHARASLAQFAAIDSIVSQAGAGQWAAAEAEVVSLTKAQRGVEP